MNKTNHILLDIFSTLSSARFKTADRASKMRTKVITFSDEPLYFLIMKASEMHYFSDLFDKVLYMFRTGPCPSLDVSQNCIHAISTCHASSVGSLLADSQQN
jgi:hypothetical protein